MGEVLHLVRVPERQIRRRGIDALRNARAATGMSEATFAHAVNRTLGYGCLEGGAVTAYERGECAPPADVWIAAVILAGPAVQRILTDVFSLSC